MNKTYKPAIEEDDAQSMPQLPTISGMVSDAFKSIDEITSVLGDTVASLTGSLPDNDSGPSRAGVLGQMQDMCSRLDEIRGMANTIKERVG